MPKKTVSKAKRPIKAFAKKTSTSKIKKSASSKDLPKKSMSRKQKPTEPSHDYQTPLASMESHTVGFETTREMGASVANHPAKKDPLSKEIKDQSKHANNVSHSRSHASQYRG